MNVEPASADVARACRQPFERLSFTAASPKCRGSAAAARRPVITLRADVDYVTRETCLIAAIASLCASRQHDNRRTRSADMTIMPVAFVCKRCALKPIKCLNAAVAAEP